MSDITVSVTLEANAGLRAFRSDRAVLTDWAERAKLLTPSATWRVKAEQRQAVLRVHLSEPSRRHKWAAKLRKYRNILFCLLCWLFYHHLLRSSGVAMLFALYQ